MYNFEVGKKGLYTFTLHLNIIDINFQCNDDGLSLFVNNK